MKRTINSLPTLFLGSFTLAMLVWLMVSPTTQAAPPLSASPLIPGGGETHLNLPFAIPRMATVTLTISEPFVILPPTTTVTIDFNNPADTTKFSAISFDGRIGFPYVEDYVHPALGADGDSELRLNVSEGKFDASIDRQFVYFFKEPITDLIQIEVEILAAPKGKSQAAAGIELRTLGPTNSSTSAGNPKVYLTLARDEAATSLGHRLWTGWRLSNSNLFNPTSNDLLAMGAFRVHEPNNYKPVWLRITRNGNTYRFYYKDTAVSPNWKQLLGTTTDVHTLTGSPVVYNVALGNLLYISLFGVSDNNKDNPRTMADAIFDNLTYIYTPTQQTDFSNWTTTVYGSATAIITAPNTNATGQLVLQSNGKSVAGIDDNTSNSGYVLFSYKNSVASTTQFETLVQVKAAPIAESALGGLEVRSTLASNSPKLSYGLQREGSNYRLYAYSRDDLGNVTLVMSSTVVNLTTPMWLKITRDPDSNIFNFYQAQNTALPSSWTLYATTSLSVTSQIYSGLFNTSNSANSQQISQFDNFQMTGAETADDPISELTIPNNTGVPNQNIPVNATVATGTNLKYSWSLGDGNTATSNPITLNYFSVGTYTLMVTATNNISTATTSATVIIKEVAISGLNAVNNSPKIPRPEGTIATTFTATVAAGSNVSYAWNFGDGRTGLGQVASNLYQNAGTYTVLVTATNSINVVTATTIAIITDNPIQGIGFNNVPNPAYEGTATRLAAYPSPDIAPKATNVTYTWTLPGGVLTSTRVFYYTFPLTGSPHIVSVTACNNGGVDCKTVATSIIIEPVPDVKITGFTATVDAPTPIGQPTNFSAQVVSGTNVLYQWEFSDGTILMGQTVSRILAIGTYKVTAVASNNQGFKEQDINFTVYGIPNITLTKSAPEVVKVGEQVKYTLNITNSGTDDAFNVVVTDTVPAQATFVSNSGDPSVGFLTENRVVWDIGTLAINQHATMYLTVDRPTSGLVTNSNYILMGLDRISQSISLQGPPVTTDVAYPPVANAGALQDVPPGSLVTLNGAGSYDPDKKPLTYFWQQISGSTVTLSGTNTMSPTFISPTRLGDLKFRLTVTNSSKLADDETVIVRVSYEPIFDITKSAPVEVNYNDLITYTLTITNRGTAPASQVMITDVIPTGGYYVASNGGLDGGEWVGNAVIWSVDSLPINSHVVVTLAITATNNVINRDYSVSSAEEATAKGKISLVTLVNLAPIVNAGRKQTMLPNILTTLDGRKTSDPGNLAMTYLWTQVDGPAVTLNNPTSLQPTFTTPSNFADLRFRLTATNSKNLSNFAEVIVKVAPWTTVVYQPIEFSCSDSEATIKAKEAVRVTNGNSSIYVGYQNAHSSRDPITMKFTNGNLDWCRTDYETTARDGAGYGLLWDGNNVLYGVYTSDGSGDGNDFRRFSGWIESYIESARVNAGKEVPVIAKIDPANGSISPTEINPEEGHATFITALDFNYTVNKVVVNDLALDNNNLVVEATAWETPRQTNKLTLACNGKFPYAYSITFLPDLSLPVDASAIGCKETVTPPGVVSIAGFTTGFISKTYNFNASVSPFYTTAPLTYTWFPEPLIGQGTTKASYLWPKVGVQTLVLTVENRGGFLTQSHRITITDPLAGVITITEVSLTGPMTGFINMAYTFSATISPTFATPPLVYGWSPAPNIGQGTAEVSYRWPNSGTQTINLIVTNLRGAVSTSAVITINEPPPVITAPSLVTISGPITGRVNTAFSFTATVSPTDVTLPLSYTWSPEPLTGQGSSQVQYNWTTTGTQTMSLTVSNQVGLATGSYTIETMLTPTLNLTPTAKDDFITTTSNTAVTIAVLTNDSDPDADTLTIAAASPPQHGVVTVLNDTLMYTPTTDYVGGDTFTYTISDGRQGEAMATVTVLVFSATEQVIVTPIEVTKPTTITVPTPGGEVVIEVPEEITTENFILVYKTLMTTSHVLPKGYGFGGQFFILQAYMDGQLQTRFTFTRPMTITLTYSDTDVANLLEETLQIRYWHEISQTWEIDGLDNQPPDTTLNTVTAFINHLTEFALIGEVKPEPLKSVYLPIILRK